MKCAHPKSRRMDMGPLMIWCTVCGAIRYWREGFKWLHPRGKKV